MSVRRRHFSEQKTRIRDHYHSVVPYGLSVREPLEQFCKYIAKSILVAKFTLMLLLKVIT